MFSQDTNIDIEIKELKEKIAPIANKYFKKGENVTFRELLIRSVLSELPLLAPSPQKLDLQQK